MKTLASVNQFVCKVKKIALCLDANYWKGLLSNQERAGVLEYEIHRPEPGGVLTDTARCLKARYTAGYTNFKGDNSGVLVKDGTKKGYAEIEVGGVLDMAFPDSKTRRGRVQEKGTVCGTLDCGSEHGVVTGEFRIRKLTPKECFRLQGFPDEYFERASAINSDTQLYKQAGNSVTVNVIRAIAEKLKEGN